MAKGKSKGRNNSGGSGGAAQPIDFTGKETKEQLIQKVILRLNLGSLKKANATQAGSFLIRQT